MKFAKKLSIVETVTLRELHKNSGNHRMRERALIILMSSTGFIVNNIALAFNLDRDTISEVINTWEERGLSGLYDAKKSGRPPIFTEDESNIISAAISAEPRNLKAVAAEVETKTGKRASKDTIKRVAKKKGFIWKRIRKVTPKSPDPKEYNEKQEKINNLKVKAISGEINLYFVDESGFSLTPVVPYAWQKIGQQVEVPSQRSRSINVLGFLGFGYPGELKSIIWENNINSACVIDSVEHFFKKSCKETWLVFDNASIHTSGLFQEKIVEWRNKGLHVLFLPKYSPELNLIEMVWRFMKYYWIKFDAYRSIKALKVSIFNILNNYGSKYHISFA